MVENGNDWYRYVLSVRDFPRELKRNTEQHDVRYIFFLGAGCSKSSGIPTAKDLVYRWLAELKGDDKQLDDWAEKNIGGFDRKNPAASYGNVFKEAYKTPHLRQQEIERACAKARPELGYLILSRLMVQDEYRGKLNLVLTTNFDDLVTESLYLFTEDKPRTFVHESLFEHLRLDSPMPTVCKLHGDAHIETRSTPDETERLFDEAEEIIRSGIRGKGLIFIGYGGNDESIVKVFDGLTGNDFPWGVYWVRKGEPGDSLKAVFRKLGNVTCVAYSDFDGLMVLIQHGLKVYLPKTEEYSKRYTALEDSYLATFTKLAESADELKDADDREALEGAVRDTAKQFKDWWAVEIEARKYKETDPDKADEIYRDGLEQFPDSHQLMNAYALFLKNVREDYDGAEEYYKRAIKADPENSINLNNYGWFLYEIRKDYDGAEEYYKRAIKADPNYVRTLNNYGHFLEEIRKDYDAAEEYYERAIKADPDNATNLGNYAFFLEKVREDYDAAEDYYKRALEADPNYAIALGNYAGFLFARGRADEAKEYLEKAFELADNDPLIVESYFYRYAHSDNKKERAAALSEVKKLITSGVRSPGWDLSQNVARAVDDGHPEPEFLALLAKVIADQAPASELDKFEVWKNA